MTEDSVDLSLLDGSRIRIRPIGPADKDKLSEGFDRLSMESIHQRFLSAKTELTEAELTQLTDMDGTTQFALGAAALDAQNNEGEGIGVARFFRDRDDSEIAELGITVVDEWQGRGVGGLLLERLVRAAARRGIRRFRSHIMAENQRVLRLIKPYLQDATIEHDGSLTIIEMPMPTKLAPSAPGASEFWSLLHKLLEEVAKGAIIVPVFFGLTAVRRLLGRTGPDAGETDD